MSETNRTHLLDLEGVFEHSFYPANHGGEAMSRDIEADLTHWKEVCYAFEFELQSVRAENALLREALAAFLDDSEVHDFGEWLEARMKQASAALDPDGQRERRAKALSELAEIDADLLDIEPEKNS